MQELLARPSPPSVIVLELYPQLLEQHGFPGGAVGLLESLWERGYTDISHSGYCLFMSGMQQRSDTAALQMSRQSSI